VSHPPADHARDAYDVFAPFYDQFTAGHEHDEWAGMVLGAARRAGLRGRRLLDVGCGTGESFLALLERGFEVTACDVSPAMVALARRKARGRAAVCVADMRELPRLGEFDLVWCLGDALNYLHDARELVAALAGMRRNLAGDGIVAFDVNTLATFRRVYSALWVLRGDGDVIVLDGHGSDAVDAGGSASVWIDRLSPRGDGPWARDRSVHHHRHHPLAAIEQAIAAAGLETVQRCGSSLRGLEPDVDESRHIKAVFLARHARARDRGRR
jgi:SAM-dependent methyltransferase